MKSFFFKMSAQIFLKYSTGKTKYSQSVCGLCFVVLLQSSKAGEEVRRPVGSC